MHAGKEIDLCMNRENKGCTEHKDKEDVTEKTGSNMNRKTDKTHR